MENLKLSAPWITFVSEVKAMFGRDPEIKIEYLDKELTLKLFVDNQYKAQAIAELLPTEREFGNVTLKIEVIPANDGQLTEQDLYEAAFAGNPILNRVVTSDEMFITNSLTYVEFVKEVIQYWNDDLSDLHGNCTTLAEDIARDLFHEKSHALFCTSNEDPCGPLKK